MILCDHSYILFFIVESFFELHVIVQMEVDYVMIQRPLKGYEFPVYTTESCPRNLTKWNERSSFLNCTRGNAYMCVPNENFTELLEFCYNLPQIQISKGIRYMFATIQFN